MEPEPTASHPAPLPQEAEALPEGPDATEGAGTAQGAAAPDTPARPAPGQFRELLDMIKFEHTVFALPFALIGALAGGQGWPRLETTLWILAAMVGARTAAMTYNRLVDEDIDAANPRTASRALPAGRVSRLSAWLFMGASLVLLGYAAGRLGPLPWKLTPLAVAILLGYSLCKRFTPFAHVVLGLALAGAPLGAWIAVTGTLEGPAWLLALGVLAWTTGFDILYALQDQDFDRSLGLHSIPARLGTRGALAVSRACHVLAICAWAAFNLAMQVHVFPWLAWIAVSAILAHEQYLVRGGRLDRIDQAFFTLNSLVGMIFLAGHLIEWTFFVP